MKKTCAEIEVKLVPVLRRYGVRKAVLFGSFAKGSAHENSDVDLLVDSGLKGLSFVGLIEDIRQALDDTEVDVLDVAHIKQGSLVDREIRRTGIRIYEA